jgi:hypothetical protein
MNMTIVTIVTSDGLLKGELWRGWCLDGALEHVR